MHEKVALQNAKVDGFQSKLNNSEEFNKAFKTIMESLKNQAEQMTIESANFGEKVTREFEQTKNEMSIQINTLTNKLMSYDIKLE